MLQKRGLAQEPVLTVAQAILCTQHHTKRASGMHEHGRRMAQVPLNPKTLP